MIRFLISNGKNSLKFDVPTKELSDHLQSIGISEDIPIGGTEKISIERFPKDDKIAKNICDAFDELKMSEEQEIREMKM